MLKRLSLIQGLTNGLPRVARTMAILVLATALPFISFNLAAAATFTASLDAPAIFVNESATLTLTFEGGQPAQLPAMPSIPNLRILDAHGDMTSMSIVNGQMSRVYSHTYAVMSPQPGEYVIPSLAAELDGQILRSAPLTIKVLPATAKPPAPTTAFLKLVVPKTNLFIGEVLPVEIQVYFLALQASEEPHFKEEGFTLGSKLHRSGQNVTMYNNQRVNVVSYYTYIVPVKAGKIDLGPATWPVRVPAPNARRTIFGEITDWQSVTLQSEPSTLSVQPLPRENVPASFSGAVGNWTLAVEASPTNVAVGDPITVKVQIAGRGSLDAITLPAQTGWEQFKLYPPTSEIQTIDSLGISGNKTFKLTAVPQSLDIKELPAFAFSFFDPDQKAYRTLTQPAIPLTLRPSAASLPPGALTAPPASPDNADSSPNILSIKQRLGTLAQIQPPIAVRDWFIMAQLVPIAVWLSLLIRRKNAERLAANPRLRRQRLVEQIVRDGLKKLDHAAQQNDAETFFALAFQLLQEQLGERLDRPASAITESVLDEPALVGRLPAETLAAMHDLFHTFNQARYAPQSTNAELISLAHTVREALNILKQLQA